MRISDWSSDVCSSDLHEGAVELAAFLLEPVAADYRDIAARDVARTDFDDDRRALLNPAPPCGLHLRAAHIDPIGSASCRERGCQSVQFPRFAEQLPK